jgi:hypothetical protein
MADFQTVHNSAIAAARKYCVIAGREGLLFKMPNKSFRSIAAFRVSLKRTPRNVYESGGSPGTALR